MLLLLLLAKLILTVATTLQQRHLIHLAFKLCFFFVFISVFYNLCTCIWFFSEPSSGN